MSGPWLNIPRLSYSDLLGNETYGFNVDEPPVGKKIQLIVQGEVYGVYGPRVIGWFWWHSE